MVICLAHALSVAWGLLQQVEPTLVNHVALENGQMLELVVVKTVSIHLDVKPVYPYPLVPLVRLDMKVMTMEDVERVVKEHTHQPVVNALLVLPVNGLFL